MKWRDPITKAPTWTGVLLWIVVTLLYLPPLAMMVSAFRVSPGEITDLTAMRVSDPASSQAFNQSPMQWSFHWFFQVFEDPELLQALARSFQIAVMSSVAATLLGTLAAIAMAKTDFYGKRYLQIMAHISLGLPEIVFALALLACFFVLRLTLGTGTVVIAHTTFTLAFVITTVLGRLASFDPSIEWAARDLGASELQILFKIKIPLLKPALFSALVMGFLLSFDDFLITFFVNSVGNDTLPVKLYASIKYGITPKLNAVASMLFLTSSVVLALVGKLGKYEQKENI